MNTQVRALLGVLAGLLLACTSPLLSACETLPALLGERLSLMDEVAAYKWLRGEAIEDKEREAAVIEAASAAALARGLAPAGSRRLFIAQMEAAKDIQRYWISRWEQGESAPRGVPDLALIRTQLNRLGDAIVDSAGQRCQWGLAELEAALSVEGLPAARRDEIVAAVAALQPAVARW